VTEAVRSREENSKKINEIMKQYGQAAALITLQALIVFFFAVHSTTLQVGDPYSAGW
jgi:hypothetical protein